MFVLNILNDAILNPAASDAVTVEAAWILLDPEVPNCPKGYHNWEAGVIADDMICPVLHRLDWEFQPASVGTLAYEWVEDIPF